jgi:hypothetical protein
MATAERSAGSNTTAGPDLPGCCPPFTAVLPVASVGSPDQLSKRIFAEEVPSLFGKNVTFQAGVDLAFAEFRLDGLLHLASLLDLSAMPGPWSFLRRGYAAIETKMPGDHTDRAAFARAMARRQLVAVDLLERKPPDHGPVALWMVAPHAPEWLWDDHKPQWLDLGCYRLPHGPIEVLWIAANELPLRESLLPFLVARSGRNLVELVRWSLGRRPAAWVARVLTWSSMSPELIRELEAEMKAYGLERGETEEERERQRQAAKLMLLMVPEVSEELRHQGELAGLREGRDAGLREGERRGKEAALREAILDLCEMIPLVPSTEQRADLEARDLAALQALRAHLKQHRTWP